MTDPRLTDELRRAFEVRAAGVRTAPDALAAIRSRIGTAGRRRRVWTVAFAGLATAAAAVLTAILLALPWTGPTSPVVGVSPPRSTAPAPAGTSLPVYVVGEVAGRQVLYREYHRVTGAGVDVTDHIRAALTDMIAGRTLDPDYHSDWPATASVHSVGISGDTITVDLSVPAAAAAPPLALQQLVYTATAVAANDGPSSLTRVRVEASGATALWGVDLTGALTRASSVDVLAPVWLSEPQEGDVLGHTVNIQVVACVPGAVAMLVVWDGRGATVVQRAVALSADAPARGEAVLQLTLAPGRYRIEAYELADDGSAAAPDDHVITVR